MITQNPNETKTIQVNNSFVYLKLKDNSHVRFNHNSVVKESQNSAR